MHRACIIYCFQGGGGLKFICRIAFIFVIDFSLHHYRSTRFTLCIIFKLNISSCIPLYYFSHDRLQICIYHLKRGFDFVTFEIFLKSYLQKFKTSSKTRMNIAVHIKTTPDPPMAIEAGR